MQKEEIKELALFQKIYVSAQYSAREVSSSEKKQLKYLLKAIQKISLTTE